jgi:transposase InsO family protein
VGVSTVVASPIRAILDTGAGPNLVRADLLPNDWERYRIADEAKLNIVGAGGKRLRQQGVVLLHVEIGGLRIRTRFVVITDLAAQCILGCQFIDRHVTSILPGEKKVILSDGSVVYILHDSELPQPSSCRPPPPPAKPSTRVRVAKWVTIPPRAESLVWVQCAAPGLRFLQAQLRKRSNGVYMANGVADILPQQPFPIRVVNTSPRERKLPKGMVLGDALPHPQGIVALVENWDTPSTSDMSADVAPNGKEERHKKNPSGDPHILTPVSEKELSIPNIDGASWREQVDLAHLLPPERKKILAVLARHRSMWDGRLGQVNTTHHRIELKPGSKPIHSHPYRAGPRAREAEAAEVQRMLKAGVIEQAHSEWASPVVLVPKPDGSMRFCVDYRRLNALTMKDSYPLPRMDECIDSLGDATIFSTLDCNSGYWQIPVHPEDRDKTTFTSHEGLYRFLRMPFGLTNAPATFQRMVDMILAGLTWKSCLVYLDDIIVFSASLEEHVHHLDEVLERLYRAGLSLKLPKCHFGKDTVSYLGHVIRPGKLAVAEKNTIALRSVLPPATQSELRSFLGLCNVYRRFVAGFSKIAAPLNALLRKGESPQLGTLTGEQLHAFETLRAKLLNPPILALPRAHGQYILDTDASNEQIGCCLFQEQADKVLKPIGYWSRSLTTAERNYSTTEKECLAIVWAILQLRPYLEGQHFIIRTDHHSLRWVLNLADAQGRLARWRLRLLEFDYEVHYAPGKGHHGADTMSRLKPEDFAPSVKPVATEIPCFAVPDTADPEPIHIELFRQLQAEDTSCRQLHHSMPYHPSIDLDETGVLGRVLPSGEFQVQIPHTLQSSTPVTILADPNDFHEDPKLSAREDAHVLRREEYKSKSKPNFRILRNPRSSSTQVAASAEESVLPQALQTDEIIREQGQDLECQEYAALAGAESLFDFDDQGLLVRKAPLDGVRQIVVPAVLRPRLLHLEHFPKVAGHPGTTRMFRSLRRRFFWKGMGADVAETIRQCTTCAKNRVKERKRTSFLKLFPASSPLEYVSMDILGPLPKTDHGNRFLLVITDRFSKLTRTVPLRTITAFNVAKAFCDAWVFAYGPPRYLLTDNGAQFAAKFFLAVCRELGIAKVFTTAYHPQTNGQVERFNRTVVNALRGYVSHRQGDWDEFTAALTFGYNCRIHSSLGLAPFELVLSRPPPPLSVEIPDAGTADTPATAKMRFLLRLRELCPLAQRRLEEAQARYKRNYDGSIREKNKTTRNGDWVYVRREVHDSNVNPKLDSPVDGPFQVVKTDGHTLVLQQGETQVRVSSDRITPAPAPPSTLSPRTPMEDPGSQTTPRGEEDEPEYVVERIVGAKQLADGSLHYKVRWYGYYPEEDTWEPAHHLPKDILRRYHQRTRLRLPTSSQESS